jgi:5-(carboxyamino)imidazole ribonucleotide synthase
VPAATAAAAASVVPVRPSGGVLHTTQNRLREKTFLSELGIRVAPFTAVRSEAELQAAIEKIAPPAILKTAGWGYDGKGQVKISSPGEAAGAWKSLATDEAVLEAFVDFAKEVSVVAARGLDGSFTHWGVIENEHARHILDVSTAPADVLLGTSRAAVDIARAIAERLELVGVFCVEFFVTRDEELLVNEIAPRPHNSGHLTIDACVTSQFEQQLRAICGLPLGSTEFLRPAAMANLLGDLWARGEPNWPAVCRAPQLKLHLYGKATPRAGRKMGHLTVLGETAKGARLAAIEARARLTAVE